MKSSHLRMLLLLGALGLACSPESAFSQEKAPAQAYAGKTVTGEVTVKQTVEDTLQSHRGLKVMQENLDVVRHELRRAKAGWGPSVDAVGRTGASRLSNTTTRPLNADKDMYGHQVSGGLSSGTGFRPASPEMRFSVAGRWIHRWR